MSTSQEARVLHGYAAAIGGAALAANAVATGLHVSDAMPAPFIWRDVALVYFLAALPMAATLATSLIGRLNGSAHSVTVLLIEALVLFAVPAVYLRARCENEANRAAELVRQSRFGEASHLLHQILALRPATTWNEQPLSRASASIDRMVRQLDGHVATALPAGTADPERIERAQQLAMLGRTGEALLVLASSPTLDDSPPACNLRGTIYETQDQWRTARQWYAKARVAWRAIDDSPERTAGLNQAIKGIAFCERKLGRLRDAETAWRELLALSPTADSHFLLAQFYEDTQQAAKARFHAQQAMELAPDRYQVPGRQLIDKLVTSHFGCAAVFSANNSPATPFGPR